jgi:hypothetical protein
LCQFLIGNGISPDDALPRMLAGDCTTEDDDDSLFFETEQSYMEQEERDNEVHHVRNIPIYVESHTLAVRVLNWSNALPGGVKDSTLVQFCSHIMQIPANVAKGHRMGLDLDMIGGNIACLKRALAAANAALELLHELRPAGYVDAELYRSFYEDTYEIRNQVGVYVQDLRWRFDLGIE